MGDNNNLLAAAEAVTAAAPEPGLRPTAAAVSLPKQTDTDGHLSEALKAINAAVAALDTIHERDISEITRLTNPPAGMGCWLPLHPRAMQCWNQAQLWIPHAPVVTRL